MTAEDLNQIIDWKPLDPEHLLARIRAIESWIQHDDKFSGRSSSQMLVLDLIMSQNIGWNLPQSPSWFGDDELLGDQVLIIGKEVFTFFRPAMKKSKNDSQHSDFTFRI